MRSIHRNQNCRKIREYAQSSVCKVKLRQVGALTLDGRIPAGCDRLASEDVGQNTGDIIPDSNGDDSPNGDMQRTAREDSEVQDKYGNFDKTRGNAVDNCSNQISLCPSSVR